MIHVAAERFIGDLGTVRDAADEVVVFGYFGHKVRANPDASDLAFIEFMDKAERLDEGDEVAAVKMVMAYLRDQIHPDDWDLFWQTAKENRQTSTDLMMVSHKIQEAVAGFPTTPPPGSRAGRRATARKSGAASRSRETRTPVRRSRAVVDGETVPDKETAVTTQAMAILDGRPDLKVAVWEAHTARVGG